MRSIITEILAGNSDAFRVIVTDNREELLRVAWHFVHDWEEAKDITQDTFIRCFRSLNKYNPDQPFKPWLYKIHLNGCRSASSKWWRRLGRERRVEEDDAVTPERPSENDVADIRNAIERLSKHQKAAFIMIAIEEHSTSEAACELGIAESTLRVHLARAREKLRNELKDRFEFES